MYNTDEDMKMKLASQYKLLCYSDNYYLFCKGTKILLSKDLRSKPILMGKIPSGSMKSILSSNRLFARMLRLEPRCGIFVNNNEAIVSYHGAIYHVNCNNGEITLEHIYRPEMKNPLCFVNIEGINGFDDGIYYGEYYLNHQKKEVNLYKRNDNGTWNKVFTFDAGQVYHIHGIIPDKKRDCVYILTGDTDEESGIYRCKDNFKEVKPIIKGKQKYRACVALPTEKGLLYTTDTPLEENYLYHLDFETNEVTEVSKIAGPSIYGKSISDKELLFSTSVEPDSRITGLKYEFTYKLGLGVVDRFSHLYQVTLDDGDPKCREIFMAKKDVVPMGAGQFGTMMFPAGKDMKVVTCQALRKYDNKTILFEDR